MRTVLKGVLLAGLALTGAAFALTPPESPKREIASVIHGTTVPDPWRWLEDTHAAPVNEWIGAQNVYAETHLSGTALGDATQGFPLQER